MPEALHIPLSFLIVFASAKLLGELFERLGQPGVVGEILAGFLIGPSMMAWIAPDDMQRTLAELGVMFLLFRVGLDVKPEDLLNSSGKATLVATCGVIVPLVLGWAIMAAWGYSHIESVFVGAAMVATSVGITASVLASRGLLHERSAQIILTAAVIDDVLGLLVLASVSSAAKGEWKLLEIGLTTLLAVGFVVAITLWGNRLMGKVIPKMRANLRLSEAEYALAMVLLFVLAVIAVYVGVAAIVGAFFAGIALSGRLNVRVNDLAQGATELLVPFFLAGIGMRVDLTAFHQASMIGLALVILLAAMISKFLGCGLASYSLGRKDAVRIGVGMIPRGEVGMVVAQLGLTMGVVSLPVYSVVVFMAVATTIIAPPLISMAYAGVEPKNPEEQFRTG